MLILLTNQVPHIVYSTDFTDCKYHARKNDSVWNGRSIV